MQCKYWYLILGFNDLSIFMMASSPFRFGLELERDVMLKVVNCGHALRQMCAHIFTSVHACEFTKQYVCIAQSKLNVTPAQPQTTPLVPTLILNLSKIASIASTSSTPRHITMLVLPRHVITDYSYTRTNE